MIDCSKEYFSVLWGLVLSENSIFHLCTPPWLCILMLLVKNWILNTSFLSEKRTVWVTGLFGEIHQVTQSKTKSWAKPVKTKSAYLNELTSRIKTKKSGLLSIGPPDLDLLISNPHSCRWMIEDVSSNKLFVCICAILTTKTKNQLLWIIRTWNEETLCISNTMKKCTTLRGTL